MDLLTHLVSLWFQNDYWLYTAGKEYANDGDDFQEWAEEILTLGMPNGLGKSVLLDLLGLVDWSSVAESLRES